MVPSETTGYESNSAALPSLPTPPAELVGNAEALLAWHLTRHAALQSPPTQQGVVATGAPGLSPVPGGAPLALP